jgi:hypothetical protein
MDARERLKEIEGQLNYVRSVLNAGGLEAWEAKEYAALEADYIAEAADLKKHIADHPEIFN